MSSDTRATTVVSQPPRFSTPPVPERLSRSAASHSRMNARTAAYWTTTTLVALALLSGGAAYLLGAAEPLRGMAELGYPAYFVTLLGI